MENSLYIDYIIASTLTHHIGCIVWIELYRHDVNLLSLVDDYEGAEFFINNIYKTLGYSFSEEFIAEIVDAIKWNMPNSISLFQRILMAMGLYNLPKPPVKPSNVITGYDIFLLIRNDPEAQAFIKNKYRLK